MMRKKYTGKPAISSGFKSDHMDLFPFLSDKFSIGYVILY